MLAAYIIAVDTSHSARGAWIETDMFAEYPTELMVALREGCVDRNLAIWSS